MGVGLLILFIALFSPPLFSIIFLLFRLSSRFGYSLITLRAPMLAIVVSAGYTVLALFASSLSTEGAIYWLCGILIMVIIVLWVIDSRYLHKLAKQRKTVVKKLNANRQVVKNIARIALAAVLAPLVLFTIMILWTAITNPIFDKFDHDKFVTLDTQMQKVYQNLKTASGGADNWKYRTVCSPNRSGWTETGTYNCIVSISTEKIVTSVDEVNRLQAKYYPIVDESQNLKQKTELDPEMPGDFGKNFLVSSAEKNYIEVKSGVTCNYSILLYQNEESRDKNSDSYGSNLTSGKGSGVISIRCDETARSPWYQLVQNTSTLIPE